MGVQNGISYGPFNNELYIRSYIVSDLHQSRFQIDKKPFWHDKNSKEKLKTSFSKSQVQKVKKMRDGRL